MSKLLRYKIYSCLTLAFPPYVSMAEFKDFHKKHSECKMQSQKLLLRPEQMPPRVRYERLFSHLPLLEESNAKLGRHPISRNALLRALIYKSLRKLPTLSDLVFELENNPAISAALDLSPLRPAPSVERFSSFLRDTPNENLHRIRRSLVAELLSEGVIVAKILTLDSCPIVVTVKENNLKTKLRHSRFDKTTPPRGDKDARLGILVHYPSTGNKKINYFWGYRNHVLSDAVTELPLEEITHPANVSELTSARIFLRWAHQSFGEKVEAVTSDAEYDSEDILEFILNTMKALPVIPRNPRSKQLIEHQIKGGKVYCMGELPMVHRGKMTVKATGISYRQYSCPLHWRKKMIQGHLFCPAQHHKYIKQKGCNVLIRLTPNVRSQIDYGSQQFKEIYDRRPNVERIFSRLLAIAAQEPTVRGLTAIRNHVTVAHIAVLLVAITAHCEGHPDKLRYVRSFVPNFLV